MEIANPYQVLGVPVSATEQQIRGSYRRLAAQHHPDRNPDDATANERMGRINRAYALLTEPGSRVRVDAELARGRSGRPGLGGNFDATLLYTWVARRMQRAGRVKRALVGLAFYGYQLLRDRQRKP